MNLTAPQKEAVLHKTGPIAIFAGAGSGKTRVIVHRIAHLVQSGVDPRRILALSFTNKAAKEMRERLQHLIPDAALVQTSTFHSSCAYWLREYAVHLGYTRNFSIYDTSDAWSTLKSALKSLPSEIGDFKQPEEYETIIHHAKNSALFPQDLGTMNQRRLPLGAKEVYTRYQELLHQANAMDFDDLILNVVLLLRRDAKVRDLLQGRYDYVLVDEFQDTNPAQIELLDRLCEKHTNICVVGDDDQSIYSWRCATPRALIEFDKTYPGAHIVKLGENFRSTKRIVSTAAALIAHNENRVSKDIFSNQADGELIDYRLEENGTTEAWYVVDQIEASLNYCHYSDIGILYRTNAQSRLIEEALRSRQIPYQIIGAVQFYERLEIKDVLAYMRLLVQEHDDASFKRVVNVPTRGIGKKSLEDLEVAAQARKLSLFSTAKALISGETATAAELKLGKKFAPFMQVLTDLKTECEAVPFTDICGQIVEHTEYFNYLKQKFPDQYEDKIENVQELAAAMVGYADRSDDANLQSYLQDMSLSATVMEDDTEPGVQLMSLHSSKGLEFERVFIIGVEDGLIPHANHIDNPTGLEEERRLMYVGITRARSKLFLTAAEMRTIYNQTTYNQPSRFLQEMPVDNFRFIGVKSPEVFSHHDSTSAQDDDGISYVYDDIEEGSPVRHAAYGKGVVMMIENNFGIERVIVDFSEVGKRKVLKSQLQR